MNTLKRSLAVNINIYDSGWWAKIDNPYTPVAVKWLLRGAILMHIDIPIGLSMYWEDVNCFNKIITN